MATTHVASVQEIRTHFPALERQHNGHPIAYFDGPGGTQVPRMVVDAMADYLYHHNANTHWNYPTSAETDQILDNARQTFADFFNCNPNEVVFGPNMTTLTFHVSRALSINWGAGDDIVVTELDHHANVDPWMRLAKERGVTVHKARMNPETGQLDWGHLASLINSNTKLLAIGAASNALGTVTDVGKATEMAHAVGALVYVDAVHYAAHNLPDVKAIGCNFLACSPYKFYGPHLGTLYGKHELLESLDVPKLIPVENHAPDRIETGTQNHEGIHGAAAAVDFLASLAEGGDRRTRLKVAIEELHHRAEQLTIQLWEGLSQIDGITLYGPAPDQPRTSTVGFTVHGKSSADMCKHLATHGLFASDGDFYATTVIDRLGIENQGGLVRIGCACYTTKDEIERLLKALRS